MGVQRMAADAMINRTVGFLTVLGIDEGTRRTGSKGLLKARCRCGAVVTVLPWKLRSGEVRSCGCMHRVQCWDAARDAVVKSDWPGGVPCDGIIARLVEVSPDLPPPTPHGVKHRALSLGVKRPGYAEETPAWPAERIALLRALWPIAEMTVADIRARLRDLPGDAVQMRPSAIYRKAKGLNLGRRPLVPERLAEPQRKSTIWTPAREAGVKHGWQSGWSSGRIQSHVGSIDADRPAPSWSSIKIRAVTLGLGLRAKAPKIPKPQPIPAPRKFAAPSIARSEPAPRPILLTYGEVDIRVDAKFARACDLVSNLRSLRDVEQEAVREIAEKAGIQCSKVRVAIGLVRVARHEGAGA